MRAVTTWMVEESRKNTPLYFVCLTLFVCEFFETQTPKFVTLTMQESFVHSVMFTWPPSARKLTDNLTKKRLMILTPWWQTAHTRDNWWTIVYFCNPQTRRPRCPTCHNLGDSSVNRRAPNVDFRLFVLIGPFPSDTISVVGRRKLHFTSSFFLFLLGKTDGDPVTVESANVVYKCGTTRFLSSVVFCLWFRLGRFSPRFLGNLIAHTELRLSAMSFQCPYTALGPVLGLARGRRCDFSKESWSTFCCLNNTENIEKPFG